MRITGKRIRRAFENVTTDSFDTILSHDSLEKGVVIPMNEKKNIIPFALRRIAAVASMLVLLLSIGAVILMILNKRTDPQLSNNPTENQNAPVTITTVTENGGPVDTAMMEFYLTESEYCDANSAADILPHLKNVTPDALKDKCSVYRFPSSLGGDTFFVYEGNVYLIGTAYGGHGVTEFAYVKNDGREILYFIYSWGSGIHRSHIGAFDFNTKQFLDYTEETDIFMHSDIAFYLSEDGKTLGISRAQILQADSDTIDIRIEQGDVLCNDIRAFDFTALSMARVFQTSDIKRITLYTNFGTSKGADVPEEHLREFTIWVGSFVYSHEADDLLPPGTDTIHIEIEYSDGRIVKQGINTATINGVTYYVKSDTPPESYEEIISSIQHGSPSDIPDGPPTEEKALAYMKQRVKDPSKYTLFEYSYSPDGLYTAIFYHQICGVNTSDLCIVIMREDGSLYNCVVDNEGAFDGVQITNEMLQQAKENMHIIYSLPKDTWTSECSFIKWNDDVLLVDILATKKDGPTVKSYTMPLNSLCVRLPMKENGDTVDKAIIEEFLKENKEYAYEAIKGSNPNVLSGLRNVTPELIKDKCAIYRFTFEEQSALSGQSFLVYNGKVYQLGSAWGGFGITEFAYVEQDGNSVLYYIYSWEKETYYTQVGAFDFGECVVKDSGVLKNFPRWQLGFFVSETGNKLGICSAVIKWNNPNVVNIEVTEDYHIYDDIREIPFSTVCSESTPAQISIRYATELALSHFNCLNASYDNVYFLLEENGSKRYYEIRFSANGFAYACKVDAFTGEVYDSNAVAYDPTNDKGTIILPTDPIIENAIQTALKNSRLTLSQITELEYKLDTSGSVAHYDISFVFAPKKERHTYEFSENGEVLKISKESYGSVVDATAAEAIEIALQHASTDRSKVIDIECVPDRSTNTPHYNITFYRVQYGLKFDAEVNTKGNILEFNKTQYIKI